MSLRVIASIIAAFAVLTAKAAGPDLDANVAKMRANGAKTLTGESKETGLWIMALGRRELAGSKQADAMAMAELDARNAIAAFFQAQISSSTEMAASESNGSESQSFAQWARTDVNALLKGCRIERTFVDKDMVFAVALLTQKGIDASATMKTAMTQDRAGTVTANGSGVTKDEAIQKACRSALEQVCGSSVVASDANFNDDVRRRAFSDVQGVVSSYRILEEKKEGNLFHVKIVAAVDKDELLDNYGAQMKSVGDPVFLLECSREDLKILVADWMTSHGIKVNEETKAADYKITVKPLFVQVTHPGTGRTGVQLSLSLDCSDKAGNKFFSLKNDPRKAAAFIGNPERQTQICVDKAMQQMEQDLHSHVHKAVSGMVNNGRQVRLIFRNVTTKEQVAYLQQLASAINDMGTAGSAAYALREDVRVATIRCNLKGGFNDFIDALKSRKAPVPAPLQVTSNKAVFEF